MQRQIVGRPVALWAALLLAQTIAALLVAAAPAGAVVLGTSSSLGGYTVRLVGPYYCSGVAIARRYIATAAHCANRRMRVMSGGGSIGIAGVSHSAVLDDGRRVSVAGDAVILKLAEDLPFGVSAAPLGSGDGDSFTIAGYGTIDEAARGAFGSLHEAKLVAGPGRQLVDPNRSGAVGASACFGDSGGPVMRGGALVGVITRANCPRERIACGFYTRWAPVRVSGTATAAATADDSASVAESPRVKPERRARRTRERAKQAETPSFSLFASWFARKAETAEVSRRRSAQR